VPKPRRVLPSPSPQRFCADFALALLACALPGCVQPRLDVLTEPANALVYVDGRAVGRKEPGAAVVVPLRYYGTTALHGREPPDQPPAELLDQRQTITVEEPFSPWLFPLDFLLETMTFPFQTDRYQHRATLELGPRTQLVDGIPPRNLGAIQEAARRAVLER
jgi:hypothetical protein